MSEQLKDRNHNEDKETDKSNKEEESVPEVIQKIINDPSIPPDRKGVIIEGFIKEIQYRSPIPPPEILSEYNNVISNGAERILIMAEKQLAHRIEMENKVIEGQIKQSEKGQNYGFISGCLGMVITLILALVGQKEVACVFGGGTIVGLVTVFVVGKKSQEKDLASKK